MAPIHCFISLDKGEELNEGSICDLYLFVTQEKLYAKS